MKKHGIDKNVKHKIIAIIHAVIPDVAIYIFGSRASGRHHARSDIDLALDGGKPLDRVDVGEIQDMLTASHIPYSFDIVDMHAISDSFKQEILKTGSLWTKKS